MRRCEFITLIGGATVAWPFAARAQQSKVRLIGALLLGNADAESFRTELRDGLRKLGYVEGQNINFEFRSADGNFDLLPKLAAELVALRVDVIVALYTPCALGVRATREIPIVVVSGDPVGTGLVTSLKSPGREHHRRIPDGSGIAWQVCRIVPRYAPVPAPRRRSAQRRGSLLETDPGASPSLQAEAAGIQIAAFVLVRGPNEIDAAFAAMKKEGAGAVVVHGSLSTKNVAELALKHGLPAATQTRSFAEVGGSMSYGADGPDIFRKTRALRDQDLAGRQPCKYAG